MNVNVLIAIPVIIAMPNPIPITSLKLINPPKKLSRFFFMAKNIGRAVSNKENKPEYIPKPVNCECVKKMTSLVILNIRKEIVEYFNKSFTAIVSCS